jgi:hypothetical protein
LGGVRIWDVAPGYLNRGSLLGEHRELHGLRSILVHGKTGYSRHPETLRWVGCLSGLALRHDALVAEMRLRGYVDRTPVRCGSRRGTWPRVFVTDPADQLALLRTKYDRREQGRIPLPRDAQQLWAQHKYSVMARSPETYQRIGRAVARMRRSDGVVALARDLVLILREPPAEGRLTNALEHMWGHVRDFATPEDIAAAQRGARPMFLLIQALATRAGDPFLTASTALSELGVYVRTAAR